MNGDLEVLAPYRCLWLMEGLSSDDEHDLFSSDEEGARNVENFLLCSFAHPACSPSMQGFLLEEELCKVALVCHFSVRIER